jgi:methylthioribose-1-phosphate isomerase
VDISKRLGFSHIRWEDDHLVVMDQRKLPLNEEYIHIRTIDEANDAIKNLVVRGAPLIGITAAYGLCLLDNAENDNSFFSACETLKSARPTAVNLAWAVARSLRKANRGSPENPPGRCPYVRADRNPRKYPGAR